MTYAIQHDLAEAVVTVLQNGSFTLDIEPALKYGTKTDLTTEDPFRVDVVPGPWDMTPDSRISIAHTVEIHVAVRYLFPQSDQLSATGKIDVDKVGQLMLLTEQIAEELGKPANRAPTGYTAASWIGCAMPWPWVPDDMERGQYTGVVRATYRVSKEFA